MTWSQFGFIPDKPGFYFIQYQENGPIHVVEIWHHEKMGLFFYSMPDRAHCLCNSIIARYAGPIQEPE